MTRGAAPGARSASPKASAFMVDQFLLVLRFGARSNTCPLGTLCVTRLGVDFIRFHPLTVWSYRDRRVRDTASNRHYNLISTLFTCWYKWISVPPCPSEVAIKLRLPSPDGREAQRPSPDEEADGGDESSVRELRARRQADRSFPRLHLHRRTVSVLVPPEISAICVEVLVCATTGPAWRGRRRTSTARRPRP